MMSRAQEINIEVGKHRCPQSFHVTRLVVSSRRAYPCALALTAGTLAVDW